MAKCRAARSAAAAWLHGRLKLGARAGRGTRLPRPQDDRQVLVGKVDAKCASGHVVGHVLSRASKAATVRRWLATVLAMARWLSGRMRDDRGGACRRRDLLVARARALGSQAWPDAGRSR